MKAIRLFLAAAILLGCVVSGSAAPAQPAGKMRPKRVGNYTKLLEILKQNPPRYYPNYRTAVPAAVTPGALRPGVDIASASTFELAGFSSTLVQVSGVDEGDVVKNDAGWIYQINNNRVLIIRAQPLAELGLAATLDFSGGSFYPRQIYLEGDLLIVVGISYVNPVSERQARQMRSTFFSTSAVQLKVYDISNPEHPELSREIEVEGDLLETRKIGSKMVLVTRDYPESHRFGFRTAATLRLATPAFRDSRRGKKFRNLGPANIYYFPGFDDPNYLVVSSVDLANSQSFVKVAAFLGAGDKVYATRENLYVTASRYNDSRFMASTEPRPTFGLTVTYPLTGVSLMPLAFVTEQTDIYKFSLSGDRPQFVAAAQVPGVLLNSYSMDEYDGHLRLATTARTLQPSGLEENAVYVLNENLELVGQIEHIAPSERIYSARFIGSRLFLVTFRQIDPLYAIDLSDPANPVIRGELKVPGYSGFLLPLDENHLIGIGKDVHEELWDDPWRFGRFPFIFTKGIKLSLFDVSDMADPTLLHEFGIGDRGTESQALYDPHSLFWDATRGLLGLPVMVAMLSDAGQGSPWQYGEMVFQGAYVFHVSPQTGFNLRATVSHLSQGRPVWHEWDRHISRILSIGSDLYTLSDAIIKANDIESFEEKAAIQLPSPNQGEWGNEWEVRASFQSGNPTNGPGS
jgi:inhibitor of cysteine peptidase